VSNKNHSGLTPEQFSNLMQLASACGGLSTQLEKLKPLISHISSGKRASVSSENQADVVATLRASQILKSCVDFMRPPKTESEGIMRTVNKILQLSKGPSGFELISFPVMRKQLLHTFNGERVTIPGAASNIIDAVIMKPLKSTTNCVSPVGTGIFIFYFII
jgi:hypothetical protein